MMAGEAAAEALIAAGEEHTSPLEVVQYESDVRKSWVWEELDTARNVKPAFKWGLLPGMAYTAMSLVAMRGKEPWTFRWTKRDTEYTKPAAECKKIEYPKPDGKYSFDILENLIRSGVNHEHDQPAHLKVKEERRDTPLTVSLKRFDGPEGRFCP